MNFIRVSALSCFLCSFGLFASAEELSDEFNAGSLAGWTIRDAAEGGDKTYDTISVGRSKQGWLTIIPLPGKGWYRDGMGPMVYKTLEGDFLVETNIITEKRGEPGEPPGASYNSAGLIVRDPSSKAGTQNWFVVNVGMQAKWTGSEAKTTVNSNSNLELQQGAHNGKLRLARLGTKIYALRMLKGEDQWTIIRQTNRPDLPSKVQVGLMANGWSEQADLVAHYDYIHFSQPTKEQELTSKE